MKPLVTTARTLTELATGLSPDAVAASSVLFQAETAETSLLITAEDDEQTPRVVIFRVENRDEHVVPDWLGSTRREVLSRMASFAERAQTRPLSLPIRWHQYKHDSFVAFFATSAGDPRSTRWLAQVLPGDRCDVVFWKATTGESQESLQQFARENVAVIPNLEEGWRRAISLADTYFASLKQPSAMDVAIDLQPLEESTSVGWTYEQWIDCLNDRQRAFVNAPTHKSIRLRGPAGSGKTLALTLKAVREVKSAREANEPVKVLIATHSWALAVQVAEALDQMGLSDLAEVDALPLLAVAQEVAPQYGPSNSGFQVIGDDSLSGKQAQLDEIHELLHEFVGGDWVTYASRVSEGLRLRFETTSEAELLALAWDLLVEFGSVIGAAAIFPGAGSDSRYFQLPRSSWMLPLETKDDLRVVFAIYSQYMESLERRSLMTSDQVLTDCLSHLETHAWNRARKQQGYDLVFVDEFHLFSPLERQVLHYLTRDVSNYPRVFVALDPRQSPSAAFIGAAADDTQSSSLADDRLGEAENFELTTVHRFTPQILELVKHVHHEFPTLDLGQEWDIDFSSVESAQADGAIPRLIVSGSRSAEEIDIHRAVSEVYSRGRIAIGIVDQRYWARYSRLASLLQRSTKHRVALISGRSDAEALTERARGVVIGPAEYLAGLQFHTVFLTGLPDLLPSAATSGERRRLLSLLYLGLSRAEREVRIFCNDDDGGPPEVLVRAVAHGLVTRERGREV